MHAAANRPGWVVDLKSRIVLQANEEAAELWGYSIGEMIGMSAERLIHSDELERARTVRDEHVSGNMGTWKCVRRDGAVFYLNIDVQRGVRDNKLCAFAHALSISR
jgi:PAS domain S-box-containing protein